MAPHEGDGRLRARFQAQGRAELAERRERDARRARGMYAALAGLATVVCLGLIVVRLGRGESGGVWVGTYAVGGVLSGCGFVLARRGRTRWAMVVVCVAVALAGLGDSPALR
ncbi:hypothetical protein [Streptomyces lanatus]|uniref:Integral membrane protein n=1 Tax=Streptomyces lanatus TaxID=66900 RepID=A0ABV1Y807_9ACTN|nr:hypothetical protein [Streptomyces lanatus]GHH31635.1 hypothetical protein GCM10018780_92780 [Streptomyces lanatus]